MKIIEALKKIKDLQRKASDLRDKMAKYSAKMSFEESTYVDQRAKINSWMQAHHDIVMQIENLRERVAKTNIMTPVTIDLHGREITKSIHSWISRRRDLCDLDVAAWMKLTDRNLHDQAIRGTSDPSAVVEFRVVRFYDQEERDDKVDKYRSEKTIIDGKLEIVNAITDLLD